MAKIPKKKAARSQPKRKTVLKVQPAPQKREKRPMEAAPRIGAMSPEDFEAAASDALGGRGWQKSFRAGTGLAQSTLTRYLRGIFPIPQHVAVIVEMLQTLRHRGLPVPDAFTIK